MNRPLVIDIYHGDDIVDFRKTLEYGIIGCIHKSSEGLNIVDKKYKVNRDKWAAAGQASLPLRDGTIRLIKPLWGAYHFFHGKDKGGDPTKEADRFIDAAKPDADTALYLDWETDEDGYIPSADEAREFIRRVESKGYKIGIYSGNVAKEKVHGVDAFFHSHKLWLAQYGRHWTTQSSWVTPYLWQNNGDRDGPGPHTIPGIHGYCDNSTIVDSVPIEEFVTRWAT